MRAIIATLILASTISCVEDNLDKSVARSAAQLSAMTVEVAVGDTEMCTQDPYCVALSRSFIELPSVVRGLRQVSAPVYRLRMPVINAQYVRKRMLEFGIYESSVRVDDDTYIGSHGPYELHVESLSGAEMFVDVSRWHAGQQPEFNVNEADLVNIAHDYIDKFGKVNGDELFFRRVKYLRTTVQDGVGGEPLTFTEDATVVFGRAIGGNPVIGPGSKIAVTINGNRDVTGFYKVWREIERVERLTNTKETTEETVAEIAQATKERFKGNRDIALLMVDAGYYEQDRHRMQQYLEPTIVIVATSKHPSRNDYQHSEMFLWKASENPTAELLNATKTQVPEPESR